jgi:uncharacterized protein YhbP (UPF0306 family)
MYTIHKELFIYTTLNVCKQKHVLFYEDSSNKYIKGKQFSFAIRNFTGKKSNLAKKVFNQIFWVILMKSVFNIYKRKDQNDIGMVNNTKLYLKGK